MPPMQAAEQFTMLGSPHCETVFGDYEEQYSAKALNPDVGVTSSIRHHHPDMTLTVIPTSYANLLSFAAAGNAHAELDTSDSSILRWRLSLSASSRGKPGYLADQTFFAKYKYEWQNLKFILYQCQEGLRNMSYILFPPDDDETVLSNSKATDALLKAIEAAWQSAIEHTILVYDNGYWSSSRNLYEQVQKTTWDDVILGDKMKKTLTGTVLRFFDSKAKYREFGVPWKRGIIFYGPPGNGKTISLKALMHSLIQREDQNRVVPLYVKSMDYDWEVREIFQMARRQAPCLLILEDIDTLVSEELRSYFFNEVDGLENNDGIMIIATTNHLDKLDPGLSKRPSRFDRKYKFPLPSKEERTKYCEFWWQKLKGSETVVYPKELCPKIAEITEDFSFAYLKEAFVATLLAIARREDDDGLDDELEEVDENSRDKDDDDVDDLIFWKEMKRQVRFLRQEMEKLDTRPALPPTASATHIEMLEARLEQASLLKKVVDAIKDLVQDCNFDCNDSGIALQAMDNSHVALVSMMLKAEGFSPYRCDRNIALGINLTSLTKVLRAAQNEDILTLKAEDAPDVVNLVFESSETDRLSEYDIKLMDIDQEHLGIPDTEYAATIEMPSAEFQRICRDLIAMSESVGIEASKDGIRFSCQGDIGSGSVTVRQHSNVEKPENDVTINLSEPVSLTFSLKYLVNFCKASGLSGKVKLCLSQEVPLLVEYQLAGTGYLRFYLAPKIGDDE